MRKNLFAVFTVFAVVIGILTPTQSFGDPVASPGKSQGNGPCITSGNANSQVQSVKNPLKSCYSIGRPGPGGGIIFYYSAAGFNCGVGFTNTGSRTGAICHYLEAAPTSGTNPWADNVYR
jgi:hypothetical protein